MNQKKILDAIAAIGKVLEEQIELFKNAISTFAQSNDNFLSTQEALGRLERTEKTLYNWVRQGLIDVFKIGGNNYYLESQVQGLVNRKVLRRKR